MRALLLAGRQLLAKPGYAAVIMCTVGLAVGATTAMFSVYYGILLRPLPYPHPDELVVVVAEKDFPGGTRRMNFSASEIEDWLRLNRAFASVALHGGGAYALKTQTSSDRFRHCRRARARGACRCVAWPDRTTHAVADNGRTHSSAYCRDTGRGERGRRFWLAAEWSLHATRV
jgi:hypothetical protein